MRIFVHQPCHARIRIWRSAKIPWWGGTEISQDPGEDFRRRRRGGAQRGLGGYGGGGGGAYNAQSGTAAAPRPRRRAERLPLSGDGGGATSPRRRAKAMARFLVCGTSGWKRLGGPGDNGGGAWVFVGLLCWPGGPPFEGSGSGEAEDGGQRIPPPFVRPQGLLGLSGPLITQTAHHSDSPITQTHSCSVIRLGGCFWAGPSWFGPYWVELSWVAQFWVDQRRSVYVRIAVLAQACMNTASSDTWRILGNSFQMLERWRRLALAMTASDNCGIWGH